MPNTNTITQQINELLDETGKRADAATTGPWTVETQDSDTGGSYITGHITSPHHRYRGNSAARRDSVCAPDSLTNKDATFIASARTDIPALVAALRVAVRNPGYVTQIVGQSADYVDGFSAAQRMFAEQHDEALASIHAALQAKGEQ